jgi:soluble lytic murein transglycosylase
LLKIDPAPSDEKYPDAAARVGGIRKFVNDALLNAQKQSGKKFNDAEVRKFIDELFARKTIPEDFMQRKVPLVVATVDDIPNREYNAITKRFKDEGIKATKAQIVEEYQKKIFYAPKDKGTY